MRALAIHLPLSPASSPHWLALSSRSRKQKLATLRCTKCLAAISSVMSVSPRSVRQMVVLLPQDSVQLRRSVLCWVMVAKQVRQKSRLTSATASGSTEMAYNSTRPRSRGVKACHGTQEDMERERD